MPEVDPTGGTTQGYTGAPPTVSTEGHSELEADSPTPAGEAEEGNVEAAPEVAATPKPSAFGPAGIFPGDQSPETHNGA